MFDLADYRRRVLEIYSKMRSSGNLPADRLRRFRQARDQLFGSHPQSALNPIDKNGFEGLVYYPFDPSLRFVLPVDTEVEPEIFETELAVEGIFRYQRVGQVFFRVEDQDCRLSVYWILGYGGGLFLPFRDLTHENETFEGGRYLLDTIKGADLGREGDFLVVDFNYAYNPSCAYSPQWHCPLPPTENWLPVNIRAGERRYPSKT